jgi:DTW domain
MTTHAEILPYLLSFLTQESLEEQSRWGRIQCCGSSRSIYCSECYQLLVPRSYWPVDLLADDDEKDDDVSRSTILPFHLHVLLHDRRKSATGLHAAVLDKATQKHHQVVTVVDMERREPIPEYKENDGTYLLFPSSDSLPLTLVAPKLKRLVVLDCKWTHSSIRDHESILNLPKVHLTNPPDESHYWRWHNAGPGMLSTMEAVYVAAKEVYTTLPSSERKTDSLSLLWIFALQRASILRHTKAEQREAPFTHAGKEEQRAMRRQRKRPVKQPLPTQFAAIQDNVTQQPKTKKPRWCAGLREYHEDDEDAVSAMHRL